MLAYYGTEISPNQTETAEGFLICRNVPIARTGEMVYLARELRLDGDPERLVMVHRAPEDVFDPAAMASFEGKPVTDGHPPENVGPENFSAYARGHVQNVRREGDYLLADLYINDASLASDVQNRVKREVSCGYLCIYTPDGDGYRQGRIRGNHVAVVPRGRAGHEVAIKDAAQGAEKGRKYMSKFTEAILAAFGVAAKEAATQDEINGLISTTATVLDADPSASAAPEPAATAEPVNDTAAAPAWAVELNGKLDKVLAAQDAQKAEEKPSSEKELDDLEEQLSGGKESEGKESEGKESEGKDAAVIPAGQAADACASSEAKDAALSIIRAIRPAVAAIKDTGDRARVVDALVESIKGGEVMDRLNQAAQAGARRAADAAKTTNYDKICAEQQAEYYARNPHKKQEG